MKIGIIGLPQTGKKELFELLTHHKVSEKDIASGKPVKSFAEIRDPRFDTLVSMYKPEKEARPRIDMELLPKLEKDSISKGEIFKDIDDLDAICHVVRAFKNDSIYHMNGSVDPRRDIDFVNSELILNDLMFIEKRLERLEKDVKKTNDKAAVKERELLTRLKSHLDKELPLRLVELNAEEKKMLSSYPFITLKEMIIVLNISEDDLKNSGLIETFKMAYRPLKIDVMPVSAKIESEIAGLESEKERKEFLISLGIEEPAIDVLTRLCLKALSLISFFTVGTDEVKQWLVARGASAPEAAGVIHSDIEKGFIRAELIKYNDLITLGSEEKVKEAGKFCLKGKDYTVEDGDILNFRFNV